MTIAWQQLNKTEQVTALAEESKNQPVVIFKHSTTCSISATAKSRFERQWQDAGLSQQPYYLDLLSYRAVSNEVADYFKVQHQSPQVLVIRDGMCVYDASHLGIRVEEVKKHLSGN